MGWLARIVAIRPGEGRLVGFVAGAFAAVEMGRGLGEVGVDTLVLSRTGADALPALYVALGVVGLVVTLAYGAALARARGERFFPALLTLLAGILGLEWLIARTGVEFIFPALWVSVSATGMLLMTVTWTVAGAVFDTRQARRLFPLLTSAAIVGSLAGFLAAIFVQRLVGSEQLILGEAVLLLVAAASLSGLGHRIRPRHRPGEARPTVGAALGAGATFVARSPLMRLVAVAYVLLAILMFSVSYPFMTEMSRTFSDEGDLLTALALFSAAVTAASFLIGTLLANRIYAWLGVATAAVALPLVYVLGFGLWIARFTLVTAIVVRFAQQVTQRGISNATWGAFFSVIPASRRGPVMAFVDGVPGQIGTMLSGLLLMVAARLALEQVFVLGLVSGLVCLAVVLLIRRAYAASLVSTLREGLAEQVLEGGPGLATMTSEPRVLAALRAAARSERASDRVLAAQLLGRSSDPDARSSVVALVDDPDASVRRAAIEASVRMVGREDGAATDDLVVPRLERALEDPDAGVRAVAVDGLGRIGDGERLARSAALATDPSPRVRAELAVALGRAGQRERSEALVGELLAGQEEPGLVAGLDAIARLERPVRLEDARTHRSDPSPDVRVAAIRAVAAHASDGVADLIDAFDDPSMAVRAAAAEAVRRRDDAVPAVLALLDAGTGRAQEAALAALRGHEVVARDRLIRWSDGQVTRASALRRTAAALTATQGSPSAAFLGDVVRRRASAIEARLLTALALLGAPEASGLIRRCLHSIDPEVRAQAIEALDALGDARLARGVVRLLDSESSATGSSAGDVIAAATELRDDPDPWVRALALRTLSELLRDQQRAIAEVALADPDPVVRQTLDIGKEDEPMSEATRLVSDIDRMLVLRHVPIFEALSPEDLQRVAALAREQRWAGEEPIVREGDIGDELVVIVEGIVRVVHAREAGEHLLHRYGPGDHIGELAVLREAPRAATVIAEEPGVRGLVINGEAVGAILRERPDAAMAMLATLAERLSQQA